MPPYFVYFRMCIIRGQYIPNKVKPPSLSESDVEHVCSVYCIENYVDERLVPGVSMCVQNFCYSQTSKVRMKSGSDTVPKAFAVAFLCE